MAHAYHHSLSSVKRWGGCVDDYLPIHQWFDETKSYISDARHRCLRHHSLGIFESERVFGVTITLSSGKIVPVRAIGEQHMQEDFGKIPSVTDWLLELPVKTWMLKSKKLSETLQ